MLEFALILPFVSLMIFGIIQYSLILSAYISLRDAAWSVARYRMTLGTTNPADPSIYRPIAQTSLSGVLDTSSNTVFPDPVCSSSGAGAATMYNCKLSYQ